MFVQMTHPFINPTIQKKQQYTTQKKHTHTHRSLIYVLPKQNITNKYSQNFTDGDRNNIYFAAELCKMKHFLQQSNLKVHTCVLVICRGTK